MKKPTVEEMHIHSKIIYSSILATCIVIFVMFLYVGYLTYDLTRGTPYVILTLIILAPVVFAICLTLLLIYTGKRKFYKEVRKEELELYQKLK
ncbi:MAG: hypothetical protein JSW73_04520 [Candidatus Woesearchaeota archaeon]|nr:MAG: hypothetical protein JSW73_04520 [Candidatus Woesearchaeota archaeon]